MAYIDIAQDWIEIARAGNGLEVAPCTYFEDSDGRGFIERATSPDDIQFWSLYVHKAGEGAEWIADYNTRHEAERAGELVLERFDNLQEHGLSVEP